MSSTPEQRARWHERYLRARAGRRDTCACGAAKMKARAMCRACYLAAPRPRKPLAERLWTMVDRSGGPDACWPFTGSRMHNGYGLIGLGGRDEPKTAAHRAAWIVTHGDVPQGMNVCHTCDNRPCCNPAHLWLGTQRENLLDMVTKGRHGMQVKARQRREAA